MNTTAPLRRLDKVLTVRVTALEEHLVTHPDDAVAQMNHSVAGAALAMVRAVIGAGPVQQQAGMTLAELAEKFAVPPPTGPKPIGGEQAGSYATRKRRRAVDRTA